MWCYIAKQQLLETTAHKIEMHGRIDISIDAANKTSRNDYKRQ